MIPYLEIDRALRTRVPNDHPDGILLSDFQKRCGLIDVLVSEPGPECTQRLMALLARDFPREEKLVRFAAFSALFSLWKTGFANGLIEEVFALPTTGFLRPLMVRELCARAESGTQNAVRAIRAICADDRVKTFWKAQLSKALTGPSVSF